jgi:Protease inhibitor Inh
MMRFVLIAIFAVSISAAAQARTNEALSNSAKAVIGAWEFSDAEHDKMCTVKFASDAAKVGLKVTFDANCGNLFPLVRQIAGWKYPQGDLLYLVDGTGQALITFSEVEDGIFEAPTPGLGLLFLQNPTAAALPEQDQPSEVAGNWELRHGNDIVVCVLTLASDGFAVTVNPGCDPEIVKLNFAQWRMDRSELVLVPASGDPWLFEDTDGNWRRLNENAEPFMLVRQQPLKSTSTP